MKVFNKVFAVLMAFSVIMLTGTPVLAAESIANATVTGVQYEVEETGSAITFPITVKLGDTQLTEDTDYTVTYSNNTAVGQASLKITGIGAYEGEQLIAFTIVAKEETADTPSEDTTADEVEEVEEDDEDDEDTSSSKDSDSSKKKTTSEKAKVNASDSSSKTSNGTVKKSGTTGNSNNSNTASGSNVTTNNNSNNSTTNGNAASVSKSTVKKSTKSPKTGDYDNGLLISFAALSILLLAGGAYYIHLKRA